ncbi:protein phosphatase 1 regulatory subunit 26 [Molossus molossus]|uniref:Protein phosphatase 1 regulatory subunit 26 n=1 Tax=Molossus molossus TaxID=27622 RepID=A0A7J8EG96_MOLMO|nr:protein phosphatase 1 regulatory subunit 26 [Molossus molossus]XP_036116286.1 protein phosphatase 1 regulatory subunit 26 [Molossus molossus]KAF6434199.1 protein phosphatase 1 regulatory subunit 26 [Molossus molossus]
MFLMNAPPVLALQSTWEAFGPPGSCRFPGRFSEPEGTGGAAVSARVQMIIGTLQGDRAVRGRSQERALHRGQRGRDAQPAAGPALAACALAAVFDSQGEQEAAGRGPSALDSDSDDSVDRDIEEAIQEYLKARSGAAQPGAADRDRPCKPEPPQGSAPATLCPQKRTPGSGGVPGEAPGCASPVSVSSEDSFEQSIRAEIEQFLSEKRQHETPKCDEPVDRKPDPGDSSARSTCRSSREPAGKAHRQDPAGPCKDFVFRKPPRLAVAATQPRSLRSKVSAEPESLGGTKPAAPRPAATCRAAEAQGKARVKRNLGPGRRGQGTKGSALVREPADSSSDDGIEEAIQLYQLEKRQEASGDQPQKTPLGEQQPDPPAHGASQAAKSALPGPHRKAPGKKQPVASKAVDLGPGGLDPDHPSKPPKEAKAPAPPGGTVARSEVVDQSCCRADTSAELMCAEAILDISKTILPAPREGGDRPPPASPLPGPPSVPSRSDGDSSSVDSDDSIEQEIRTFLALKAQSGGLPARTDTCPRSTPSPLPSPGPNGQASGPKAPVSKSLDPSLSCRRKRRGGGGAVSSTPKKTREMAKEGAPDADPGQGKASKAPGREGEARGQPVPCRTVRLGGEHVAPDPRGSLSPGPGKAGEVRSVDEEESSEDKSSSLDSDEDLDTAIKDLLRSKRKLRKRCRDPRAGCRKKVRFSTTETPALGPQGGFQRGWRDRSPHLLKSCLSKSKRDSREDPLRKPPSGLCSRTERTRPGSAGPENAAPVLPAGQGASEGLPFSSEGGACHLRGSAASPSSPSDDSSSVDSDDSIELEIRKFLAEKAKESVSGSENQGGGPPTLGPGTVPRPEPLCRKVVAPPSGMCTRSQRGRGTPQPAMAARGGPRPEQACAPAAPCRSSSSAVSARGPPAVRRPLHPHRDQSPRQAGPAARDAAFRPLSSCAEAGARAGSPAGALPGTSPSWSAPARNPGADREGAPQASLTLPWGDFAHQSRLQSTWALSSEGGDTAWTGGLGSKKEKAPEGRARGAPGLSTDPKKGLPFTGFSPLLSTQLFHFGSGVSWGAKPPGLFSPGLSLPLQGPSFSAFREAPPSQGPVFGSSHVLGKEGGCWPRRKAPTALSLHDSRNSGSDEDVLDLRYRRRADRDEEDPGAWASDTSELSDTSVEDGSPVAQSKALKL